MGLELLDFQKRGVEFGKSHPYCIYAMRMGQGKAQPMYSKIITPTGEKTMGEMRVGDYVIGRDGKPKKVLGVFPQGKKKIYRVRFSDTHYADCCEEHLWSIRTPLATQHSRSFKTVALKDFKDNLRNKHNYKWCIPISEPVQFDNGFKPVIKPYLLGVLIGDGSLTGGRVVVTNASPHIIEKITALVGGMDNIEVTPRWDALGNTYNTSFTRIRQVGRNPLVEELERMGLNVTSHFKKIPEEYKYLPVEDRLELLRGLLDTDGYVAPDGSIRFSSSSKQLVEDVQWVAQSLGGVTRGVRYKKTNFGTDSWYTTINPAKGMEIVTKPFKADRVTKDRKYFPARMIHGVEFIGEEECQCISVEDQHYLTDNFIVTHNTTTALTTAAELKARTLIVVPVYLALNWKKEIQKFYPGKVVSVLRHSKEFYFPVDSDFVIITYSFVHKAEVLFEWAQMVIIDEGQLLKNMEAKRSEAIHRLVYEYSIPRVIILTGTPILNRVYELYSLLAIMHYDPRIVDPPFLKKFKTYVEFANHFSYLNEREVNVGNKRVIVREWSGSKNEDELKAILNKFMYRPPNAVTLPRQYEKIIPVEDLDFPSLQEAFDRFVSDEDNSRIQPKIKAEAAIKKAPLTAQYAKSLMEDGLPVIVYSDHVESAKIIADELGVKAITGETPANKRFKMAEEFQVGDSPAIVATIGSLSTGVNLQNGCDMVFNDLNWVPGNMDQAKYRILRIGQKKECTFHYVVGSRQDEYILEKLKAKMETIGKIYE